jgi:hypothetical protein
VRSKHFRETNPRRLPDRKTNTQHGQRKNEPTRRSIDNRPTPREKGGLVTYCGRICIYKKKINLSTSLAGRAVGIKEVQDGIWLVSFMDYDLGYFDLETRVLEPLGNPFGPKVFAA